MTRKTEALIVTAVVACAIIAALVAESRQRLTGEVRGVEVLVADLEGDPGKEVNMRVYTFPPGASVPWHIHPDAHEFNYELEGTLTLQREGQDSTTLKQGEAIYVAPNVVHRGLNLSRTRPAKVVVVRIKPKGSSLVTEVKP
jgi:quercetin dioxygenase-like cupin family protein